MPTYSFKAKKINGEELVSQKESQNPKQLAQELREQGFILINFDELKQSKGKFSLQGIFGVSTSEKINFAKNMAVMISSGVSLVKGFETLSLQTSNKKFKKILNALAQKIKGGESLSKAMENYPQVFSPFFQAMVKTGETTGKLDQALNLTAEELKKNYELKKKIRGALIYPAIIFAAMFGIGILMLVYVVPTLVATFEELKIDLPMATVFVITLSKLLTGKGIFGILILIPVFLIAGYLFFKTSLGKKMVAYSLLKIPVISLLVKQVNTARTSRTLSSLIGAGVNILEAIEITEDTLQNQYYKDVLKETKIEVQKGNRISQVFIRHEWLYPRMMGEMSAVGEESGKIAEMFLRLAEFYESEIDSKTKNLSTIIEPILMLIMGAAVGFFAIAIIQPIYSMVGTL